jgi:hypothetical protein
VKKIIISQDFEMMWGVHHLYQEKINKYMKLYLNIPKIVENTLRLLKERNLFSTWAVVGAMLMNNWDEYEENNYSYSYDNKILNFNQNYKKIDKNGNLFFSLNLIKKIANTKGQELGSHSFNHLFFKMPGITKKNFIQDTDLVLKHFKEKLNIKPLSYVFPKNESIYIDYLKKKGFIKIRETMKEHYYNYAIGSKLDLFTKPLRVYDNFNFFKNGSLNTRHNYFFLRFNLSNFFWNMQFNLIKKRILSDDKRPFHIWWHPRDLVFNVNNNLTRLTYLMDFFKFLIDKKKFLSCNILNS